jgi:prepilin-type N-terminal cleavage/methylation domain-containing protein
MTRIPTRTEKRSAFTLVEIMVVILIIAILVSLLMGAIVKIMGRIPEVKTRTEIGELEVALQAFMNDYQLGEPPPSVLVLNETTPLSGVSAPFLTKVFGRSLGSQGWVDWNGDGIQNGPWTLEGEQCLIFYVGGIPNTAAVAGGAPPGPQGFSTNNMSPSVVVPGGKRRGPYYTNFEPARLIASTSPTSLGFFWYIDAWQAKSGPKPYAYFSSQGLNNSGYLSNNLQDCQSIGALPYWTAQTAATPPIPTQFTYSNSYQIISAGKDGKFGYNPNFPAGTNNLWAPSSGALGTGDDDQANFSSTMLGKGQN